MTSTMAKGPGRAGRGSCVRWLRRSMLVAVTSLAACGGGGGGGEGGGGGGGSAPLGNTVPPMSGPGDVEAFFPDATGNTWYYDATSTASAGPPTRYFDTVTVTGRKSVLGQPASVFVESSTDSPGAKLESYYYKNDGGVAYMGDGDPSDTLSMAVAPYIEALFPVAAATVSKLTKTAVSFGDDLDGDAVNETVDLSLDVTIAGFERLDTQLGSFPRTVHGTETITGTVTLSKDRSKTPFKLTQDVWSAPHAGIIRRTTSVTVENETIRDTFEARGYVVDGVGHGLSVPYTTLSNLAPASSDAYSPGRASLACDGTNCLVVSFAPGGVVGELFDPKGATVASLSFGAGRPTAAVFDGTNYLVIVSSSGPSPRVHRVTMAGISLDGPTGIPVSAISAMPTGLGAALAAGSSNSLVVYSAYDLTLNQHLLYGVLLDRNGVAKAPGAFPIAADNSTHLFPAVVFDGTNYFVVWQQQPTSGADTIADIYGARVSQAGAVLDSSPIVVSSAVNAQVTPSVAFDGANYVVVWLDARNLPSGTQPCLSGCEIFGMRITPGGLLLDGSSTTGGIGITTGQSQVRDSFPSVGFNGTDYLVAWAIQGFASTGSTGIRLARVSTGGVVLSPSPSGIGLSGAPAASTVSTYALPIVAPRSPGAAIVWLDNAEVSGSQKRLLAVTAYPF